MSAIVSNGGSLGPKPVTYTVPLPAEVQAALKAPASGAALLRIEGVEGGARGGTFRVFVNLPAATAATSLDDPHFIGFVASGESAGQKGRPVNSAFELADAARALAAGAAELTITLVPAGGDGQEPAAFDARHQAIALSVGAK